MAARLHELTKTTIENLTDEQVIELLKQKWIAPLVDSLYGMTGAVVDTLVKAVQSLAEKYAVTFVDLETQISESEKALSAMLDELACLTRDLMVLKTAGNAGITMLSGVSSDKEVGELAGRFSGGELVRMMNEIQQTLASFTRSASRRMDAELCILSLCQPELSLDAESLNARLTRLEEQIKNGSFVAAAVAPAPVIKEPQKVEEDDYDRPPMPDDADMPPEPDVPDPPAPVGFWTDLVTSVRRELKPQCPGSLHPHPTRPSRGFCVAINWCCGAPTISSWKW